MQSVYNLESVECKRREKNLKNIRDKKSSSAETVLLLQNNNIFLFIPFPLVNFFTIKRLMIKFV